MKLDLPGVGVRRNHEIVFKPALIAVVDQVNARVNAGVMDPSERRHAGAPAGGIVAKEIICGTRQLIGTAHLCLSVGPFQFHSQCVCPERAGRQLCQSAALRWAQERPEHAQMCDLPHIPSACQWGRLA